MNWMRAHWRSRPALIGYLVMVGFIAVGFVTLGGLINENHRLIDSNRKMLSDRFRPKPLYTVVQPIQVTGRVLGVSGPAIRSTEPGLPVTYYLCNTIKVPIVVFSTVSYTKIDDENRVLLTSPTEPRAITASVEPGCHSGAYAAPFQTPLTAGRWRQISQLTASETSGMRSDSHVVISEIFQVVP